MKTPTKTADYRKSPPKTPGLPTCNGNAAWRCFGRSLAAALLAVGAVYADPADDAYRRGYACLASNRYTEAADWFQKAALSTNAPRAATATLAQAEAFYGAKQWDAAAGAYDVVLRKYPTSEHAPRALCSRGFAEFHAGRLTDARTTLAAFTNRYPRHALTPTAAVSVETIDRTLAAQTKRREAAAMVSELAAIDALSRNGQSSEASAAALRFLRDHPDHPQAVALRYLAARCAFQADDYATAVDVYRDFLARYPHHAQASRATRELGDALFKLKRFKEAADTYAALPGADNERLCAESLFHAGCCEQALDRYRVWRKKASAPEEIAQATLLMGDCCFTLKRWEEAERLYLDVDVLQTSDALRPDALKRLVRLYEVTGQTHLAARAQEDLDRRFPSKKEP